MRILKLAVLLSLLVPSYISGLDLVLEPQLNTWGININLGLRGEILPGLDSIAKLGAGIGSYRYGLFRDTTGATVDPAVASAVDNYYFKSLEPNFQISVLQGLLANPDQVSLTDTDLLSIGLRYAYVEREYSSLDSGTPSVLVNSNFADARGSSEHKASIGVLLQNVENDTILHTLSGWSVVLTGEMASVVGKGSTPGASGQSLDYYRVNAKLESFVRLLDHPDIAVRLYSRLIIDTLLGDSVPVSASTTSSSFDHYSPINPIRNFDSFDGRYKVAGNIELPIVFPGVLGLNPLLGLKLFADVGFRGPVLESSFDLSKPILTIGGFLTLTTSIPGLLVLPVQIGFGYNTNTGNPGFLFGLSSAF